jgi:NADH dehydrogenase
MADRHALGGTLVLGGGFAGGYVAHLLGKRGATIVSPGNFMLYTPLLPEAASGTLEPRHVVVPLRIMCPHSDLVLGRATDVDHQRRRVHVETEDGIINIGYEELVVALGAVSRRCRSRASPTTRSASNHLPMRSMRNHVLRRLEAAASASNETHRRRELTFVFVGAGYAGVEALGELSDLVRDALRYYPALRNEPQHWVLVDAAPKILPEIPARLGEYAARELTGRRVDIRVQTTLESVDPHSATLSDGSRILTNTVVWTAGVRANPVNERLGLPLDERGRIVVDSTLQVEGVDHTWALGDGARVPNEATPGGFDPPTCQP